MKFRVLTLVFFLFAAHMVKAQVVNIPDKAKNHFSKKYPAAAGVEWTNNVVNYTAKFEDDGVKRTAHYSLEGEWNYTDEDKPFATLPAGVKTAVEKSRFADWKIESSAYVENSKNEKLYRVEFKNGITKRYVFFDETGKEIRSTLTL